MGFKLINKRGPKPLAWFLWQKGPLEISNISVEQKCDSAYNLITK